MARVRDLWHTVVDGPDGRTVTKKTAKHPDNGGNRDAKRWQAVWIGPDGREKTATFRLKDDARNHSRKMEEDVSRGEYIDPKAGRTLFGDYGKRWIATRSNVDPSSMIQYESKYRLHVEPKFGKRKIGSIKPSEIQEYLTELSQKHKPSTPKAALLVLQGIFDLAVADETIKKNPAKAEVVKPPTQPEEKVIAWADEVVLALIDAHPEHLRPLPVLGAGCGMRAGEWFALAEEDLDFDRREITVRRQVKKLGSVYVFAMPKSDHERTVPMPDWVGQYLSRHMREHKPRPYALPWERVGGAPRTVNLLFRWASDDKHIRQRNYDETVWKPAAVKAGVLANPTKDERGRSKYTTTRKEGTHQLRHYYASATLTDGVSIKELSEYLGHSDPAFTLRVYAHMQTTSYERARQAIDKRMMRLRAIAGDG